MGGGGSKQPSSTTQTTKPFPAQEQALTRLFSRAEQQFQKGPQTFFPGETVASADPNVIASEQLALQAAPGIANLAGQGNQAVSQLLGSRVQTPTLGPNEQLNIRGLPSVTQELQSAVTNPLVRQLQEQILPSIGSRAIQQGAFGGDRQRIQEQQAAREISDAATEATLRQSLGAQQQFASQELARQGQLSGQELSRFGALTNAGLQAQGLEAQTQLSALNALPGIAQLGLLPAEITGRVGEARTSREQALIDAARERFDFGQEAPEVALDRLASRIAGVNLGSITTARTTQGSSNNTAPLIGAGLALSGFLN